jgi:hypothetical protein
MNFNQGKVIVIETASGLEPAGMERHVTELTCSFAYV